MAGNIVFREDDSPGITRKRTRRSGRADHDASGKRITDRDEIDRLNAIGWPPACTDSWSAPMDRAAQGMFRESPRLPKSTQYLTRIEREPIVFLKADGACESKAA